MLLKRVILHHFSFHFLIRLILLLVQQIVDGVVAELAPIIDVVPLANVAVNSFLAHPSSHVRELAKLRKNLFFDLILITLVVLNSLAHPFPVPPTRLPRLLF